MINGEFSASVPAGISAGKYEVAKVPPDVAISQINQIGQIVSGKDWSQEALDAEISAHGFGGNATLAVSAAFFKAQKITPIKFPKLMVLLFEGARHGNSNITFQEFLLIESTISQAQKDFALLKGALSETLVGAEGGFSPKNFDNQKCLDMINDLFPDGQIGLDAAGHYQPVNSSQIFSIEDPFGEDDWTKWAEFKSSHSFLVIGDDLTVTNPERVKKAIETKAVGAVVIKPNQIGTISAALEAVRIARDGGLKIIVSHRGEDTNDTWIVDFAFAASADFVKFGGLDRGERTAKYNRLWELQNAQSPRLINS